MKKITLLEYPDLSKKIESITCDELDEILIKHGYSDNNIIDIIGVKCHLTRNDTIRASIKFTYDDGYDEKMGTVYVVYDLNNQVKSVEF